MKKKVLKNAGSTLLTIILVYLIYVGACLLILPLLHPRIGTQKVSLPEAYSGDTERVLCIDDNTEALLWRLRLIDAAEDELVVSTFDWDMDEGGQDIAAALLEAADRGVNVRILVDGMNGFLDLKRSPYFHELIASENVEAKFYNPINVLMPWRWNYRMHDKYFIADNEMYILGGRNIGSLFLGDYEGRKNIDRDILVYETGDGSDSSIAALQEYFENIWGKKCCAVQEAREKLRDEETAASLAGRADTLKTLYPEAYEPVDWRSETIEISSISLLVNPTNPGNKRPLLWCEAIRLARDSESVTILTPYVICDTAMRRDLASLVRDGIDASLVTNAPESGANPFGCADFLNQDERIKRTGIKLYTYAGENSMHTKTILLDDDTCIVGSFNFDMRSVYLDTEMMLVIESPELSDDLRAKADENIAASARLLPNGGRIPGPEYREIPMSTLRRIIYLILRGIILPFRYLL